MILYLGNVSYDDKLVADFTVKILFGAIRFELKYDEELDGGMYFFGKKKKTAQECLEMAGFGSEEDAKPESEEEQDPETQGQEVQSSGSLFEKRRKKFSPIRDGIKKIRKVTKRLFKDVLPLSSDRLEKLVLDVIKKTAKQLLPRKIKGDFEFGFEDPYYTGKLLEIFAIIYAGMGDDLKVLPVWDKKVFRGFLDFNGHIHLVVIAWQGLRLVLNSEFRKIWRELDGKRI